MQPRIVKNADFAPGQLDSFSGKIGLMDVDGLNFEVRIAGARVRFGHLDFLVTPVNGAGEKWIESHRIDLDATEAPF
jgi:hypothetical protein